MLQTTTARIRCLTGNLFGELGRHRCSFPVIDEVACGGESCLLLAASPTVTRYTVVGWRHVSQLPGAYRLASLARGFRELQRRLSEPSSPSAAGQSPRGAGWMVGCFSGIGLDPGRLDDQPDTLAGSETFGSCLQFQQALAHVEAVKLRSGVVMGSSPEQKGLHLKVQRRLACHQGLA